MNLRTLLVTLIACVSSFVSCEPQHWAVLVAGSNGYFNYRHQADICHAYQILRTNGIPDERIIVMMYDDIAHNTNNPTPGVIINEPKGPDVYTNVPKDYVGRNVTPEVFINVLLGNATYLKDKGSGKHLASGPNDHVFVNFADHGAPGLVAFPNGELYSRQLLQTIEIMREMKKFHKMVFYVEACESGSMFHGLLAADINVYATTAANGEESSYACYWDDERETYLGDVYSVRWMEDAEHRVEETLENQFHVVKGEVNTSHVQQFGDLEIGAHYAVSEFIGTERVGRTKGGRDVRGPRFTPITDAVPSPDVPIRILERRLALAASMEEKAELSYQLRLLKKNRFLLDDIVDSIVRHVSVDNVDAPLRAGEISKKRRIHNYACFERVVRHFSRSCAPFSYNDYSLRKVQIFVNLCEEKAVTTESIYDAISNACSRRGPMKGIY